MSFALDILVFSTAWTHVLLAPFTKVEESFSLHATHDVLMHGLGPLSLENYDHFIFPGAVPRTFVGSVLLAWLSTPIINLASWFGLVSSKFDLQIIIRLVLASVNASALSFLRRAVSRRFGRPTGLFFILLTCSQFHLPFWMGRTIPNMFAFFPVTIAIGLLVNRAPSAIKLSESSLNATVYLLTFTAVIFRAEVALLLAPTALQFLFQQHQVSFLHLMTAGLTSGVASLFLTLLVDSYFWKTYVIWPEFAGIYFNVYQGKSSEWGISPPLTYLTSHLPKLLLGAFPLSFVGAVIDYRIRSLLIPSIIFIALISNIGHKEWRFIVYTVPVFNIAAARGANWLVSRRKNSFIGRLLFLSVIGLLSANILVTGLSAKASIDNYPGGQALIDFHGLYTTRQMTKEVHVHISNLAAQTGASLFLQLNAPPHLFYPIPQIKPWIYNKTENLSIQQLISTSNYTHLISEINPNIDPYPLWKAGHAVKGFDRWIIRWDLLLGKGDAGLIKRATESVTLAQTEKLWILEHVNI